MFFVFVQVRPANGLLNPKPGGVQGAPFTHNVVRGCTGQCVIYLYVYTVCCICSTCSRLNTVHPHGAIGDVTFNSGYLSFSRPHSHHASGPPEAMPVVRRRLRTTPPS